MQTFTCVYIQICTRSGSRETALVDSRSYIQYVIPIDSEHQGFPIYGGDVFAPREGKNGMRLILPHNPLPTYRPLLSPRASIPPPTLLLGLAVVV